MESAEPKTWIGAICCEREYPIIDAGRPLGVFEAFRPNEKRLLALAVREGIHCEVCGTDLALSLPVPVSAPPDADEGTGRGSA